MTLLDDRIAFRLPEAGIATAPPEQRGSGRDDVRLMVAHRFSTSISHGSFDQIIRHLAPGDALVINTSGTLPAAVEAWTARGERLKIHFSSPVSAGLWAVELRTPIRGGGTSPGPDLQPQSLRLAGGRIAHLIARRGQSSRLWLTEIEPGGGIVTYLQRHGEPIRYVPGPNWPIEDYQTVFSNSPGSVEMPSAGRPFTPELVTRLVSNGVACVPIILHAGVSSYEEGEHPGEERYVVPPATAAVINALRSAGGRVVAVGTTVVRALETVADKAGAIHPGHGITDLIVSAETGARAVDGLLTGWHEPHSSHLDLLRAFLPAPRLQEIYDLALADGALWHEFGDLMLLLP